MNSNMIHPDNNTLNVSQMYLRSDSHFICILPTIFNPDALQFLSWFFHNKLGTKYYNLLLKKCFTPLLCSSTGRWQGNRMQRQRAVECQRGTGSTAPQRAAWWFTLLLFVLSHFHSPTHMVVMRYQTGHEEKVLERALWGDGGWGKGLWWRVVGMLE
jgi:hypothetical protein